jgi:hypothetical protein
MNATTGTVPTARAAPPVGGGAEKAVNTGDGAKDQLKRREKPKQRRRRSTATAGQKGSHEARRTAAAVLEVLAGARTPTEAAGALGVSTNRYYQLEARAIQGLTGACEPRPKGKVASPEKELARLRRETDKLRNEVARFQALARASQKAAGLAAPKPSRSKKGGNPPAGGKKKRRRKPVVRALKMAKALSGTDGQSAAGSGGTPPPEAPAVGGAAEGRPTA